VSAYLETAVGIAESVAASAFWSDGRCSWIGGMPEEGPTGLTMTYSSFGADLYGGTAGVGLALAEVAAAAGSVELRSTALGAVEHALARAHEVPDAARVGLYAGRLGVALAAARVGRRLEESGLVERALTLARDVDVSSEPLENDLMSGRAGGILALLALRSLDGGDVLLERAVELGEGLLGAATASGAALSWPSTSFPEQRHLTGLSHGAAGIGLALLELYGAARDERFRAGAEGAFAYERALYDPAARNWPDLREIALRGRPPEAPPPYAAFWCHGAPGIALSRLRAYELDPRPAYRDEARLALETTMASCRAELGAGNYSLCHGLAGNAEAVHEGRDLLGAEAEQLVRAAADAGIEAYGRDPRSWPVGVFDGTTDSLFLGRAGTALFYLRLHDPNVPSLLLLRPERFGS
jgi:lantibiotic biosynthesis protein